MPLLEVKDLHTSFFTDAGEVKAVNGVSFNLIMVKCRYCWRTGRANCHRILIMQILNLEIVPVH